MFGHPRLRMLISMSELRADTPPVDWSDVDVSELPTGTVTLLLADIEGSTRLWETQPQEMRAAVEHLDQVVSDAVAAHYGVRPVEQGEGDSFVIAFARATDAVACALTLQRAPLAPILLRIGVHTGEVRLRDEGNYIGPTINRTARLRDLAHGGQTMLSGATEPLVIDQLPPGSWLTDLGTHALRDLPRPERAIQLCHPDLRNTFPPLRTSISVAAHNLPSHLTSFVGRQAEMADVRVALEGNPLVTLTGAGGVGKTRLAVRIAAELAGKFRDGAWYIELASITVPAVVPLTVTATLGLPDQPGLSTMEALLRFIRDREMLLVLDNCEHLLDACAELVVALLGAARGLTVLATSREPLGVTGEASVRVPPLSLADDAVQLFGDRARLIQADFAVTDDNLDAVTEICRRLDGMPLAIELAAARVRALSPTDIVESLHDRFRLLTGGSRTAVRRQQTLRASVDWSHALLTETERVLFRRLGVFLGGFGLQAARAVAGAGTIERYQVLDHLSLLVDKSLVAVESARSSTRYRLLETVRQYAMEKLGESGEAAAVRSRHRDHYLSIAVAVDAPAGNDYSRSIEQAEAEMDNLRGAFGWSLENGDIELALVQASSLQPLWWAGGRLREGLGWFEAAFAERERTDIEVGAAVYARALADYALLATQTGAPDTMDTARKALGIAREVDDPAVLARTLAACAVITGFGYGAHDSQPYFAEGIDLARAIGDRWTLSQLLAWQAVGALIAGDATTARVAGDEGRDLAESLGHQSNSRWCRAAIAWSLWYEGDLASAVSVFREVVADAGPGHDVVASLNGLQGLAYSLAYQGELPAAQAAAGTILETAKVSEMLTGVAYSAACVAALAAGDRDTAQELSELAWRYLSIQATTAAVWRSYHAQAAQARGDLLAARHWADDAVAHATGWHLPVALVTRAHVAIEQAEFEQAESDAHDALLICARDQAYLLVPQIFECLAVVAAHAGRHRAAARLFGAAETAWTRTGGARFKIYDPTYTASVAAVRDVLGDDAFDSAWTEGATLSADEAIGYAQRGRGERGRPTSGWASLTPAESEVVRLVCEGLGNKDIAARLFVSPRTVQTHLTHVYTKLGLASRVQLIKEAQSHPR